MVNLLFIHHTSDFNGGSDKSLFEFVTNLSAEEVTPLVCLRIGDPYRSKYERVGINVVELDLVSPPKNILGKQGARFLFQFIPSVLSLRKLILRNKINVVHVNTSLNLQGGVAAKLTSTPCVWHVRELLGEGFLEKAVKKVVTKLATRIVAISSAVEESLFKDNIELIPNGLSVAPYEVTIVKQKSPLIVNCVGRIEEWKGQHIAIEAISKLSHIGNIEYRFIGEPAINKPKYYQELICKVEKLELNNVKFLGVKDDVPDRLLKGHILLAPTCTSEPFGRTIIEGMAANNIVIATNSGGPKEIIIDGVDGFLVEPGDANELARKLDYVIGNFSNLQSIQINARKKAFKYYDIRRVSKKMTEIFKEVAN